MKNIVPRKPNESLPAFARLLSSLMAEKQMGVREAARIAGVAPSSITNWQSGATPENFLAVKRLAKALGTSLSFMLTGEDDSRNGAGPPSVTEIFSEGEIIFDGYAKIRIESLHPRKKK